MNHLTSPTFPRPRVRFALISHALIALSVAAGCTRSHDNDGRRPAEGQKPEPVKPSTIEPLPPEKSVEAIPEGKSEPPLPPAPGKTAEQPEQPDKPTVQGTPAVALPPAKPRPRSAIGTNLDQLADWSPEQALVDIFKTSRTWISGSEGQWQDPRPVNVDANGWVRSLLPGQVARTTMLWDGVPFTAGNYTVLTEGEGSVEYGQQRGEKETVTHRGAGRHVIALDSSRGGLSLTITATNPADPLRNIRVLMPGGVCPADPSEWCNEGNPCGQGACMAFETNYERVRFNPFFLNQIRNYGVLRFMDWMQTNDDKRVSWNSRPKLTDARYTGHGAPVELMVELANQTGKHPWFCMSHLADDDYVSRFAAYVRDHLKPGLKAYVEYSNEVWNGAFPQAEHARKLGIQRGLGKSEFEAQVRLYARRATWIMKLWEKAFGGTSRLVRVIASQASNPWVSEQILKFEDTAKHADALAIAPYFGGRLGSPGEEKRVARMSLDQLFAELRSKSLPDSAQWAADQAEVAKDFSVDLIAYEGGQHLTGVGPSTDNDKINALFDAANRDPRMKDLYAKYLSDWRKAGGKLFVHFSSCSRMSKWGRWGALESMAQRRGTAPKFDALQEFVQKNPPWW